MSVPGLEGVGSGNVGPEEAERPQLGAKRVEFSPQQVRPPQLLDRQTPAERYDGTPFTDRGFEHVRAREHLQEWLTELMAA